MAKGTIRGSLIRWHETKSKKHPKKSPRGVAKEFQFAWTPLHLKFGVFPTPKSVSVKIEGTWGSKPNKRDWQVRVYSFNIGGGAGYYRYTTKKAALNKFNTIKRAILKAQTPKGVESVIRRYQR
jgi:hypothetical protein